MVNTDLQVAVNGQINVIAGRGLCLGKHLHDISHIVDHQILVALVALKLELHRSFNAGPADNIAEFILLICLFQFLQLILLYLAGIADDRRKVHCVIVTADGSFCHLHALQFCCVLHQICHCFIIYPVTDSSCLIFFICDKRHRIPDIDKLYQLCVRKDQGIALFILHLVKTVGRLFLLDQLFGRHRGRVFSLFIVELIHGPASVKITQESFSGRLGRGCVNHLPIFI